MDLTAWWAGPCGTHVLACLGADVIHVESPTRLDGMRMTGGSFRALGDWWERSSFFLSANSNKRGLALDLDCDDGRDVFDRLVASADLIVENFTPRVLDNLGIGWERIQRVNPRAVLVRMPAFGLSGPWRDNPGFAQTMEQLSGLAWQTGESAGPPHNQRGPSDPNGGVHAAFAAIVALLQRDVTGRGALVEVPFIEVALNAAAESIVEFSARGTHSSRHGNRSARAAPQGIYRCHQPESWVALAIESDDEWRHLLEVPGLSDLADLGILDRLELRAARHDDIDRLLSNWTSTLHAADAVAALRSRGIRAGVVADPRLADQHDQILRRGFYETLHHPIVGDQPFPTMPFRFESIERWLHRPAPLVGQHSIEILEELGYDEVEIRRLRTTRTVTVGPALLR